MGEYSFAKLPSVSISRSKFKRTQPHGVSFNLGELVVLGIDEVIPGSTHKVDYGSLIRMSTPIAPIMDDIQFDIFSFFVPMRLTWTHWKQFMGESDSAGVAQTTYTIPTISTCGSKINTLADDLGVFPFENMPSGVIHTTPISVLPFRAFGLIYNRWFRNQNVEAPLDCGITSDTGLTPDLIGIAGLNLGNGLPAYNRVQAYKLPDYFTSALPYAQKGDPVKVIANAMPVITTSTEHKTTGLPGLIIRDSSGNKPSANGGLYAGTSGIVHLSSSISGNTTSPTFSPTNLYADISTTINDLRFAFQLQKALEKDALYGTRYWEVLYAHYAVTAPDASLQDPELLGHIKFDININQVLQTTGFTSASNTNLGTPGANSVTGNRSHLFTASFVEHGYLMHIGVARQKRHTYSQGLNKMWLRRSRFDFYHPVFANIGAQKVNSYELYAVPSVNQGVFGYQEAWADYRFLPGYNSGLLNPARNNSLDYWNLAEKFTSTPTLSTSFLKESRANLIRCLVTGSNGPDFIANFYMQDVVVNPMPLYSIPGFADHH